MVATILCSQPQIIGILWLNSHCCWSTCTSVSFLWWEHWNLFFLFALDSCSCFTLIRTCLVIWSCTGLYEQCMLWMISLCSFTKACSRIFVWCIILYVHCQLKNYNSYFLYFMVNVNLNAIVAISYLICYVIMLFSNHFKVSKVVSSSSFFYREHTAFRYSPWLFSCQAYSSITRYRFLFWSFSLLVVMEKVEIMSWRSYAFI